MKKILCLHGFLGGPNQFDFLKEEYDVYALDLSNYVKYSFEDLLLKLKNRIDLNEYNILGYSFGARLAMRLYLETDKKKKLICLAGHMGLNKIEEIEKRKEIESIFLSKIKSLSQLDFEKYWNSISLFKNDSKIEHFNHSNKKYYFENYSLSKQPYMKDELLEYKNNIRVVFGENDLKYLNYAKDNLKEFKFKIWDNCGHRLISHTEKVKKELREFL